MKQKKYDNKTRNTIEQYLISNINNMFFWIVLVFQKLTDFKIRK